MLRDENRRRRSPSSSRSRDRAAATRTADPRTQCHSCRPPTQRRTGRRPLEDPRPVAEPERGDVRPERVEAGRPKLHEVRAPRAARERLEAQRAGSSEQVEDPRALGKSGSSAFSTAARTCSAVGRTRKSAGDVRSRPPIYLRRSAGRASCHLALLRSQRRVRIRPRRAERRRCARRQRDEQQHRAHDRIDNRILRRLLEQQRLEPATRAVRQQRT